MRLPNPARNRYVILSAAVVMQMCLGATYSWSVYVAALRELTGLGQGTVQLPFTAFYFVFPAVAAGAGFLLRRWGPRRCAMLGGVLFGGGWMLAGLGARHFAFTVAGIGILAGAGVGLAYLVPITVGVRWFPRHKGLVTGVAVAGFGGGAAVVSQAGWALMERSGLSPFEAFGVLGLVFLVLVPLSGSLMRNPPTEPTGRPLGAQAPGRQVGFDESDGAEAALSCDSSPSARDVLLLPEFRLLFAAMFCGLAAGFAVNANLKEFSPAAGLPDGGGAAGHSLGVAAVSVFALANAMGRILWGGLFDRSRAGTVLRANLWAQALVVLVSPLLTGIPAGYLTFAALAGFNYGGVLVLYASSTARLWGPERLGPVYGLLFTANIPAALAPALAGLVWDRFGSFFPAMLALGGLLVASGVLVSANSSMQTSPQRSSFVRRVHRDG
ncbi:MAG: OFA family MFS transporter [Candidatus Sumerlaeia bacterium]